MEMKNKSISKESAVCGLQSAVSRSGVAASGFTLIELLVAMGILMIIVLMLANLFQQSTRAWDTGMAQAEVGLEARAVMARIQKDLSQAIANETYEFTAENDRLVFYTFSNNSTGTPQLVEYAEGDDLLPAFTVETSQGPLTDSTNLPDWVEVNLELSSDRDFSGVSVWSVGPDEDDGTDDDIRTWQE